MKRVVRCIAVVFLIASTAKAQVGNYYAGIDTSSPSFVTNLHNLIYTHTKITYYTTDVADYASRDTTGGQKVVTCVYSGENYVYTPPFAWGLFSREHTYCHSWMPTYPSESGPEYSDQHHLFPVNQNSANNPRSNHPLGIVVNPTYTYLEAKVGTDGSGHVVFEPRNAQKGDAARAMFYMALCYNGTNGYVWTFDSLNSRLSRMNEGSQSVTLLKQWSQQDPPDAWELARNDSVYKYQHNRNPFVDHPEYVNLIDFNTLTKINAQALAAEPANYATSFACNVLSTSSIQLTWNNAITGAQAPSGYLLAANTTNIFTLPGDGIAFADTTNLTAGSAVINISYPSTTSYTFSNLSPSTTYYFRLYSYNGTGAQINYKTDGSVPSCNGTTSGSATTKVVINEFLTCSSTSHDWIELVTVEDNLDLRGWTINWFNSSSVLDTPQVVWTVPADTLFRKLSKGSFLVFADDNATNISNDQTYNPSNNDRSITIKSGSNTVGFSVNAAIAPNVTNGRIALRNATGLPAFGLGDNLGGVSWGGYTNRSSNDTDFPNNPKTISGYTSSTAQVVGYWSMGTHLADITAAANWEWGYVNVTTGIPANSTPGSTNSSDNAAWIASGMMPVQLTTFIATATGSYVHLEWKTATEISNYGFEVEKRVIEDLGAPHIPTMLSNDQWTNIGFVPGSGTSNTPHTYRFSESELSSGRYAYRIKQIDFDGSFIYSSESEVEIALLPHPPVLFKNFPNPFNPCTTIRYQLSQVSQVELVIVDLLGRNIATLVHAEQKPGYYATTFSADYLASGMYIYQLTATDTQNHQDILRNVMVLVK